jgi:hypothetical protein
VSETGTIVYQRKLGGTDGMVWMIGCGKRTPVDTTIRGGLSGVALVSRWISDRGLARIEAGESQVWASN